MSSLHRRRLGILPVAVFAGAVAIAGCGGGSSNGTSTTPSTVANRSQTTASGTTAAPPAPKPKPKPPGPSYPQVLGSATGSQATPLVPVVRWHGKTAAWIGRSPAGVAVLSFDQSLLELRLHSGTVDAGAGGWRFGPAIAGGERKRVVAAFNGGFRLSTGAGGFMSYGRVAVPLRAGLGSIVTYADGSTDIGSWHAGVPMAGKPVVSVRQNLTLLVNHGAAAASVGCTTCWGATLGGVSDPARSALGITNDGRLVWAGAEHATVADLTDALLRARVARAVELDINPEWVAGYVYGHRGGKGPLAPVAVMPGQVGIPGQFLAPWSRDFFTVVVR